MDRTGKPRYGYAKPYMVVYLVNDTDEPIPRIVGELNKVRSHVKFGGNWFSREPLKFVCGSVPAPKDLPAHSALALGGLSDRRGNIGGEIRYSFRIPNRIIASEPQRGRYYAHELQHTMGYGSFQSYHRQRFGQGFLNNQWKDELIASNPEEFCAALELMRHYQLKIRLRSRIMDWMLERAEKQDATPEQQRAMRRIKKVLSKPWLINNDEQALADRCISALEAKPSTIYGTPEKCTATVWRFLANQRLGGEMFDHLGFECNRVNRASLRRLVEMAKAALDSSEQEIADAAAGFLGSGGINESLFPTEEFVRFLQSDRPRQIHAGLAGLKARNRIREAIPWLSGRLSQNDPKAANYYRSFRSSLRGEMEELERDILIRLFEANPLHTLETISVFGVPGRVVRLPGECTELLRGYLTEQLTKERMQWWADEAERDMRRRLEPGRRLEPRRESNCQALSEGIRLLDVSNDPADVPLLQSFLKHPAAISSVHSNGSSTLHFSPRMRAKQCLERRNIKVPDSVVTRIDMKPPPPARDRSEDFVRYILRHDLPIMATSLAVLIGACIILRRKKSSNPVPPLQESGTD